MSNIIDVISKRQYNKHVELNLKQELILFKERVKESDNSLKNKTLHALNCILPYSECCFNFFYENNHNNGQTR